MNRFLSSIIIILVQFLFSESPLSARYHTYDKIDSTLHAWNNEFGLNAESSPYNALGSGIIYKLIDIGNSTQDGLPFWAVKLSFNADVDEDQPRTLILGQCHAEEILGVEIAMEIIYMFLHPNEFGSQISALIEILIDSEVWIVPTYNPEGLSVVHGWEEDEQWIQDVSYRKNKMDANHNGIFDFDTNGYGNDIDGVDLNRNYGFNWIFGDEFLVTDGGCPSNPSYVSNYDYYRGESPFSENETAAIRDLALEHDFTLSIAYHSSRSGCVAERVIFPWIWGGKISPDYSVIQPLAQQIAELTLSEAGSENYHFAGSSSPKGNAHDWFYKETGCIQYLIEVGTANMQPDNVDLIEDTIQRNLPGAFYAMKRAAGINGPDKHQVTGIVYDSETGEPLEDVEIIIDSMNGGVLSPRLTDQHGRYRRLLTTNSYNLLFKKSGYEDYVYSGYTPSADNIYPLDVHMSPKEYHNLTINLTPPDMYSNQVSLYMSDDSYSYYLIDSPIELGFYLPEGNYDLEISASDLFPHMESIELSQDTEISINLHRYNIVFSEDFEDLSNWEIVYGDWNTQDGKLLSQEDLVYSNWTPSGNLRINSQNNFPTSYPSISLQVEMKYEVEWDNDTLLVDLITNQSSDRIFSRSDQLWENKIYNIPIESNTDENWKIGLGINRDSTIGYRGVSIENLKIIESCIGGDSNHDGSRDVTDIVVLVGIVLGDYSVLDYLSCNVDANADQGVDILDIIRILNIILGD